MVQKDYLLRQIEKMGAILAGIRAKAGGAPVAALAELRVVAARAGVALEFLDALDADSLLAILGEDSLEKLLPAAEVLTLKGELEERAGQPEKRRDSVAKAGLLVRRLRALLGEDGEPALLERVEQLRRRLSELGENGRERAHGAG